jgi:CBS domain containing-hemolysin-like protein
MQKTMTKDEPQEPPSRLSDEHHPANDTPGTDDSGLMGWVKQLIGNNGHHKSDSDLREALEEYIEHELGESNSSIARHERALLANILKLRDMTVVDVMVPRADIVAIPADISQPELLSLLAEKQYSRIPVYRESLDDIVGTIHIKDILACMAQGKSIVLNELVRDVPIVSPSMPVLDLLLMMKQIRKHQALVVDEFGGIDGLVTIGDVIESIVGDIEDEHDDDEDEPQALVTEDGTILADARLDIEEFEDRFGKMLSEEEREDNDTLGGLVFSLAGRVPARGEILTHDSGMVFEILDADPRRVNRVRIRNVPQGASA